MASGRVTPEYAKMASGLATLLTGFGSNLARLGELGPMSHWLEVAMASFSSHVDRSLTAIDLLTRWARGKSRMEHACDPSGSPC